MQNYTATYSPEDNKLRIYSAFRLDKELYARVREAGFIWAPKQDCFVAPMWTPARADFAMDLCGAIGDEDTSLVERAEDRADRFEGYSENRARDAETARAAVQSITEHIPLGQPILVGHHSERHARKDAERIENGMRRAVKMWETSSYWERRAKAAVRHAQYKQLPGVRHRRIKTIEADQRKHKRDIEEAQKFIRLWQTVGLTLEQAKHIANYDYVTVQHEGRPYPTSIYTMLDEGTIDALKASEKCIDKHTRAIAHAARWLQHIENRLAYERAMLDETGGVASDKFDIQPGGRVLIGGEWLVVVRVNKANGRINSVTTNAPASMHWRATWKSGIESVQDYRAPEATDAEKVKEAKKLPPLVNFPGEGFLEMTVDEYKRKPTDYKGTRTVKATAEHGAYRYRSAFVPGGSFRIAQVFITDAKRTERPTTTAAESQPEPAAFERQFARDEAQKAAPSASVPAESNAFARMREQLREGIKVVSAPQLFPTPSKIAARMVEEAAIEAGHSILEPSAGTGRILQAVAAQCERDALDITAIEINLGLSSTLAACFSDVKTKCADFLECDAGIGKFDRILMNPPFANGQDIAHIAHALDFLKPGGRLVAICADGPRQKEKLLPLVEATGGTWEPLPAGTFTESGTGVSTALITIEG